MRKKALLIVNPTAGKHHARDGLLDVVDTICGGGMLPTVMTTRCRGDAAEIAASLAADFDLVICCGGDGTVNEVISGMMRLPPEKRPPIGYVPAGTTNDLAAGLGLPRSIKDAAKAAVYGSPRPHDIGVLNKSAYFTYIASFGAFTEVSYTTPQQAKNVLGHSAYVLEGIKSLKNIRPVHMRVSADGAMFENDYIFGAVSNATSIGGIVRLRGEDVDLSDGEFEVMLIQNLENPLELQNAVHSLTVQRYCDSPYIKFLRASHVVFESDSPMVWTVDGESSDESDVFDIRVLGGEISIQR